MIRIKSKKQVYKCSKTKGNEAESLVEVWFQNLGIKYTRENTVRNTRIRNKGSVDFVGDYFELEVKRYTKLLTFKYGSNIHDIHWEQIEHLYKSYINSDKTTGLLITEDAETFYFIHIKDFMNFFINNTRKSINNDIAKNIGVIVTCEEELKKAIS